MRKLFLVIAVFLPFVASAQHRWEKSSPLEYMWKHVGNRHFSAAPTQYPCIAFNQSGELYVAYKEGMFYGEATVMKFNGTNWEFVGEQYFSDGEVWYTSLAFSQSDEPYVAYRDGAESDKVTVMKFDGTNWVVVGTAGISSGSSHYTSLAFSPTGQPYPVFAKWVT